VERRRQRQMCIRDRTKVATRLKKLFLIFKA
jgi:hypothetical protein